MAYRIFNRVLWSILLTSSVLAGGGPAQGLEESQETLQGPVRGVRSSSSFYSKHPFNSLILSQSAGSSGPSDLPSDVSGSYQTRNSSRSDGPALRKLVFSDSWHSFMPSQSLPLLTGKEVSGGSTIEAVGFQGRLGSPVRPSSGQKPASQAGHGTSWANLQDAVHPFYPSYGQNIGFPAVHSPHGSGFAQSPYVSLQRFGPHDVSAPSQLLVPQVSSFPAQMPSSQGGYPYSHVSSAPDQGMAYNAGSVPSQSTSRHVGSSFAYGLYPSSSLMGEEGVVPPVTYQGGSGSSQITSFAPVPQVETWAEEPSSPYSFTAPAQTAYMGSSVLSQPSSSQVGSGPAHAWHLPSIIPSQVGAFPGVSSSVQGSYGTLPVGSQGGATISQVAGFQPGLGYVVVPQFGSMADKTTLPHAGFVSVGSHQSLPGSGLASSSQAGYHSSQVGSVPVWTTTVPVWPMWAQMASAPASAGVPHVTGQLGTQFPGYTPSTASDLTVVPHRGFLPGHAVGVANTPHMVQRPARYSPPHSVGSPVTSGVDLGLRVGYFGGTYNSAWGPNDWSVSSSSVSGVPESMKRKAGEGRKIHSLFVKRTSSSKTENDKETGREMNATEREEAGEMGAAERDEEEAAMRSERELVEKLYRHNTHQTRQNQR